MICPRCGIAMNPHAEKLVYPSDATAADPALGGVVEELHTCPGCGASASRRAVLGSR
jgi:ribosomal protein S27AE